MIGGAGARAGTGQDITQPTRLMKRKEIYVAVHVDDVFMVGKGKRFEGIFRLPAGIEEKFVLCRKWCQLQQEGWQ